VSLSFVTEADLGRAQALRLRLEYAELDAATLDREALDLIVRRAPASEIALAAEATGLLRLRDDELLKAAAGTTSIGEVLRTVV
jgi:type II secretory ATPase GspE/PulE/Tfp pilus assembly ATPase PilB-like protein